MPVRVVHDSELLLAAAEVDSGVAVISGTGSVAWCRNPGGEVTRVGGWGYLLGDEGSGYWVTRMAVRHALERVDLGEPADLLSQQLAADCGLQGPEGLLDHFYAQPERRYWASRGRVVFELAADQDPASSAIVSAAADALADMAARVADRIGVVGPIVLAGGQAVHQPLLQERVRQRLAARAITDVRVLDEDPVGWARQVVAAGSHEAVLRADDVDLEEIDRLAHVVVVQVADRRSTWRRWNLHAEAVRKTMDLRFVSTADREAVVGAGTPPPVASGRASGDWVIGPPPSPAGR